MKPKTLVLLAVAGGCGLVRDAGIQQAMQGGQGGAPKVNVLVAREDIQPGIQLNRRPCRFPGDVGRSGSGGSGHVV